MLLRSELALGGRGSSGVGAGGALAVMVSDYGRGVRGLSDCGERVRNLSDWSRDSGSLSCAQGGGRDLSNWGRWVGGLSDRGNRVGAQRECHDPDADDSSHDAGNDDLARGL